MYIKNISKKKSFIFITCFAISLVLLLSGCTSSSTEGNKEETKVVKIVHLNDTHSRVVEEENTGMGLSKVATLIKKIKEDNKNVLVMDAGDTVHGQTIANLVKGESIIKIMNLMGYNYMVPGNHDFNFGYNRLIELGKMSNFKIISANIKYISDDKDVFTPADIITVDGIRIGIFGLTTPETMYKTHPDNVKSLIFSDPIKVAKDMVEKLKDDTDCIICLGHIGLDPSSEVTSERICKEVDGIDLFVDGHSHTTLETGLKVDTGTLIVQTGEYDKNLGIVTLTFKNNKLISKEAELISKEMAKEVVEDKEVADIVKEIKASQDELLSEVIGHTDVLLHGEREDVRKKQTNLGTLIADAMIWISKADVSLTNGGGIRASIQPGDITKGDVISVLPFGNFIVTSEVTGKVIEEILYHGTNSYPDLDGRFPQVGNITYTIDEKKTVMDRIVDIKINGEPLDREKKYVIAVKDFLYSGGDGYDMFTSKVINEYPSLAETLIKYLQENDIKIK